ncbi:hypothetical protein [Paraburkholderia tropica]|uniref:hypothetical protein n=1 Tax=Paraburkholderia tropica TaxID=92647 RepID=UPI002AB7C592|nr:hypothetical protein [Paraburkholderia tropica]
MSEYVHQIQRIARLRPHGSVAQRAAIFTRHDTQCVVHEVLRLAQQDTERAFTMAIHTVVSQLSGEVTQSGHTSLSPPVIDGLFAGMLHRQTMHSMVCSPSVTAMRDGSVWKLSADALLAVNPAMVQRWYVLAHTEDGSIDASGSIRPPTGCASTHRPQTRASLR